jgi:hypothetical protein
MRPSFVAAVAVLATSSAFAATPGPDPRVEQALSTNVISQVERSVQFERTVPALEKPRKPAVDHGEMLQVREDVYVDRRLAPQRGGGTDENAIRVSPRDTR